MSLLDKLKAAGSIKSEVMSESVFFKPKEVTQTTVPIINVAFTGTLDGGLVSGLTVIAGPSKHFKTNLALICLQAYMKKYPDAVCLFYDSEFGVTPDYLKAHKIDGDRVIHIPVAHIEQLKFDLVKKLDEIKKTERVIVLVDSLGNLASKKEVEDAMDEKSVADMTRAKAIKSLFRIITPHLTMKDIPMLVVNHVYEETGMFAKTIVGGGTGVYYSANQIFIVGRSQEKDGTDLTGYKYTINIEKSRFVKEKSKLPFTVDFDEGINRYSGLLDLALEIGYVKKPSNGWYSHVDVETGVIADKKYREADTNTNEFWLPIISQPGFANFVKNKYQLGTGAMIQGDKDD
jgi:RecA/RadA recombinase